MPSYKLFTHNVFKSYVLTIYMPKDTTQLYREACNSIVVWVAAQIISTIRFDQLNLK